MMAMVVFDCWKYHDFSFSQIFVTKLLDTKGLTKSEVNADLRKVDALKLHLVRNLCFLKFM